MEFDFSSNIDSRYLFDDIADLNFADFTSEVDLDKDVDVDVFVDSDADVDGNVATLEARSKRSATTHSPS
jgi:hypothetical protein